MEDVSAAGKGRELDVLGLSPRRQPELLSLHPGEPLAVARAADDADDLAGSGISVQLAAGEVAGPQVSRLQIGEPTPGAGGSGPRWRSWRRHSPR